MSTDTVQPLLKIGEVAREIGVTPRTIRYYEELGLLGEAPGGRAKGSHRLYGPGDVARLRELVRLRDLLGLSLDELAGLAEAAQAQHCLQARWDSSTSDDERAQVIETAIPHVERQIALVRARRHSLDAFEQELTDKLARMQTRLSELTQAPTGASSRLEG